ncbi:hypothetical protein M378DRAFT_162541, partial [Amanita muscaria Koide BX008]
MESGGIWQLSGVEFGYPCRGYRNSYPDGALAGGLLTFSASAPSRDTSTSLAPFAQEWLYINMIVDQIKDVCPQLHTFSHVAHQGLSRLAINLELVSGKTDLALSWMLQAFAFSPFVGPTLMIHRIGTIKTFQPSLRASKSSNYCSIIVDDRRPSG